MKRLGVIGTMVWDTIHGRGEAGLPVEEWGGISYALAGLEAALPPEWEIVHLDGSLLIPLDELAQRLGELNPDDELVVLCRAGIRSARAVALLRERGFGHTRHLIGGLMSWAQDVDPSIPLY